MNISMKFLIITLIIFTLLTVACDPVNNGEIATIPVTVIPVTDVELDNSSSVEISAVNDTNSDGYPAYPIDSVFEGGAYPGEQEVFEGVMSEPPNPERNLNVSSPTLGAVGGVLIQEVDGTGFIPIIPRTLYLAEVLKNNQGEQSLIARGENSPKAELFSTGVFAFNSIQPGTYGLVIDLGFIEFPLLQDSGLEMLVVVEAGKVIDLGQIFVEMPNT